jgi:hypothetical protein
MPDPNEYPRDVFIAYVGSKPLVVFVDNWPTGALFDVTLDGDPVTLDGDQVTVMVFE